MGCHDAALLADHAGLAVFHLAIAALAPQLAHGFNHKLGTGHACFRQKPAGCIGRQAAADLRFTSEIEVPAFAWFDEAIVFQADNRDDGEAIIDLEEIHLRRLHLRRLEYHLAGAFGARQRHLGAAARIPRMDGIGQCLR